MLEIHRPRSLHYSHLRHPSNAPASSEWSSPIDSAARPSLHLAPVPDLSRTRFEAGLASPAVSSCIGEPVKDMNGYYSSSYHNVSGDGASYGPRKVDTRYDGNGASGYTHQPSYQASIHSSQPPSRIASRAASPEFQSNPPYDQKRGGSSSAIHPYLQLPPTISHSGGSLTEFAAQTTCLFWFESSYTLARLEDPSYSPPARSSLVSSSVPATGFLKWVTTILSTTQVTQNVVLLALLFIRRLKTQNPTVKGKPGSEYRLLTVALMLGNKFLDDNTYTNKTWAEVSGISVGEIHVMEVEFLSHMKYNLYTTKEEWEQWHKQLASLWRFFNIRQELTSPSSKLSSGRPVLQIPRALPSPPGSANASSPYAASLSPALPSYNNTAQVIPHLAPPAQLASSQSLSAVDSLFPPRKRSWDDAAHASSTGEPPHKKTFSYEAYSSRTSTPTSATPSTIQGHFPNLPNLPVPNLPTPVGHPLQQPNYVPSSLAPVSSTRSATQSLPAFNWPPSSSASTPRNPLSAGHAQHHSFSERMPHVIPNYDAASNRQSPAPAANFSSVVAHSAAQHQLSPSYFLHQRSSPYRPVRDIRTLLHPAHSGQLQSKPPSIPQEQMYWQPLGRQNERQAGRVPYLHREAWPDANQFDGWSNLGSMQMNN